MIPLYKPYIDNGDIIKVNEAISSGWISANGPFVKEFEEKFSSFVNSKYSLTMSNGSVALQVAIKSLCKDNYTVAIPSLCYVAVPNAVILNNCNLFPIDINEKTMNMDIDILEKNIHKVDMVVFVYNYSNIDDIERISLLCKKNGVILIEDVCEAFGCWFKRKHLGSFGDIGIFSFFGNKTITTGEGGMIITDNKEMYNKCWEISRQGGYIDASFHEKYYHKSVGTNCRMTNLQAALGVSQLEKFREINKLKNIIYYNYKLNINDKYLFEDNQYNYTTDWTNWLFCIKVDEQKKMMDYLYKMGIETRPFFKPIEFFDFYKLHYNEKSISNKISSIGINIPSYPEIKDDEIEYIINTINNF